MDKEEFLERLKLMRCLSDTCTIRGEEFDVCIEALEKQIPKKINYVKKYYGSPYQCSICEAEQTKVEFMSTDGSEPKEKHSYCWNCGQKLDWSE